MSIRKFVVFVFGFGLARAGLFFAPIFLANILPIREYGLIEFAQSLSSLLTMLLGFGLPASVPLILLREEVKQRWDTLIFLILSLSTLFGLGSIAVIASTGNFLSLYALVPLMVAILFCQTFWSAVLKSRGRANAAVFLEMGLWAALLSGAVLFTYISPLSSYFVIALYLYLFVLWANVALAWMRDNPSFGLRDLQANIALGLPLMLASIITVFSSTSGRIVLGLGANAETVGIYAVLFRATSLPLIAHQILIIGFFRQLFVWERRDLLKRSVLIPLGILAAIIGFWILVNWLGFLLGGRFVETFAQFPLAGKLLLIQTLLWSGLALNDLLNSRAQIAGFVSIFSGGVLVPGFLLLLAAIFFDWGPAGEAPLTFLVIGQSSLMTSLYLVQCAAMSYRQNRYLMLWSVTFFGYIGLVGALIITEGLI